MFERTVQVGCFVAILWHGLSAVRDHYVSCQAKLPGGSGDKGKWYYTVVVIFTCDSVFWKNLFVLDTFAPEHRVFLIESCMKLSFRMWQRKIPVVLVTDKRRKESFH
jgi:hypothetical protein